MKKKQKNLLKLFRLKDKKMSLLAINNYLLLIKN
jgi:hypothetical protein